VPACVMHLQLSQRQKFSSPTPCPTSILCEAYAAQISQSSHHLVNLPLFAPSRHVYSSKTQHSRSHSRLPAPASLDTHPHPIIKQPKLHDPHRSEDLIVQFQHPIMLNLNTFLSCNNLSSQTVGSRGGGIWRGIWHLRGGARRAEDGWVRAVGVRAIGE